MELYQRVIDHELVTDWFGYWPSFHDAEVLSMHLDREPLYGTEGPSLTVRLRASEMTREVDEKGYYRLEKHAVITFVFDGVDALSLEDFNHQNVIASLDLAEGINEEGLKVNFHPLFGAGCLLTCMLARIKSVEPVSAS